MKGVNRVDIHFHRRDVEYAEVEIVREHYHQKGLPVAMVRPLKIYGPRSKFFFRLLVHGEKRIALILIANQRNVAVLHHLDLRKKIFGKKNLMN